MTLLANEIAVIPPEQNVCDKGVAVTIGMGLTVIVSFIGVPAQPFAVGVIVYIAVPAKVPVVDNV